MALSPQRLPLSAQGRLLRLVGSDLLRLTTSPTECLAASRLAVQAPALPSEIELDESLCRRAGIPLELLPRLRRVHPPAAQER